MKSIFQKLYGGEIYPDQNVVPDTEEYYRDRQESSECMCALENALTKEQRILLDEAMAARSKLEYHESTVMYGAGVRFGVELMRELPRAARVRPVIRLRVKKNNEVVRMKKRKTLLERLYDGEIFPGEQIVPQSDEYKAAMAERSVHEDKVLEVLPQQFTKLLEDYEAAIEETHHIHLRQTYAEGVRFGFRLMLESLGEGGELPAQRKKS